MNARSLIVDAHQHFLSPATFSYPWLDEGSRIDGEFGPADLEPLLRTSGIDATVLVQALHDPEESLWMLAIARETPWIAGVVGWVDLTGRDVDGQLARLREAPGGELLVGIRDQPGDGVLPWRDRRDVATGLAALAAHDMPFDLLLQPPDLPGAIDVARAHPTLRLVVDHLAKPEIAAGWAAAGGWARDLATIAREPNVWCKLSGLVTEASWDTWSVADLEPFVAHAFDCFGPRRILFGTDWPVCELAAGYAEVVDATRELTAAFSDDERSAIFGRNGATFYGLVPPRAPT